MRLRAGRLALVYGTAAVVVVLDQLTKWLVVRQLGGGRRAVLGGGGNLLDRLLGGGVPLHGGVVDFVKVGPWPVFNLADSCITIGGLLLAFLLSRPENRAGEEPADAAARRPGAPGAGGEPGRPGEPAGPRSSPEA